jgi:hypothetical protein
MVADDELGTIQLFCAFPDAYPLGEEYTTVLKHGKLRKFLDLLNFLIFGVEASRNNLVLLTGLLTLLRMRYGSVHDNDAGKSVGVTYDDLLDLFPLAVTDTGAQNFVMERALLLATRAAAQNAEQLQQLNKPPVGFSFVRDNSKWLAVPLKSVLLIVTEIANYELLGTAPEETRKVFLTSVKEMVLHGILRPAFSVRAFAEYFPSDDE